MAAACPSGNKVIVSYRVAWHFWDILDRDERTMLSFYFLFIGDGLQACLCMRGSIQEYFSLGESAQAGPDSLFVVENLLFITSENWPWEQVMDGPLTHQGEISHHLCAPAAS